MTNEEGVSRRSFLRGASVVLASAAASFTGTNLFLYSLEDRREFKTPEVQTTLESFVAQDPRAYAIAPAPTLDTDDDVTLLARVLYGEARGHSRALKTDIAYSILNRTGKRKWWGNTLREVVLKKSDRGVHQYSCLNANDPNRAQLLRPTGNAWRECLDVAEDVLANPLADTTQGATHYHTDYVHPAWSKGRNAVKKTGNTFFYRLEQ